MKATEFTPLRAYRNREGHIAVHDGGSSPLCICVCNGVESRWYRPEDLPGDDWVEMRVDDPEADCTDFAHPAWWRGQDYAAAALCELLHKLLDDGVASAGRHSCKELNRLKDRIVDLMAKANASNHPEAPQLPPPRDIKKGERYISIEKATGNIEPHVARWNRVADDDQITRHPWPAEWVWPPKPYVKPKPVHPPVPGFLGCVVDSYGKRVFVTKIMKHAFRGIDEHGNVREEYIPDCQLYHHPDVPNSPELVRLFKTKEITNGLPDRKT